jgi:type IV secretory pathway TrbD component
MSIATRNRPPIASAMSAPRGRALIAGTMCFAAALTIAYWVLWYGIDRNILASSHAAAYDAFEQAFPAADG